MTLSNARLWHVPFLLRILWQAMGAQEPFRDAGVLFRLILGGRIRVITHRLRSGQTGSRGRFDPVARRQTAQRPVGTLDGAGQSARAPSL